MRVHVVGGFLGAGKTTAIHALARYLGARGERVAIVTNDQGRALVDTELVRAAAPIVREIGGGCFCCRYSDLEEALLAAADAGATVAIAEAVGSCTDLVATVLAPLVDRHADRFRVAPLAVVVDPWRVNEVMDGAFAPDVAYLFRKQIEEADVIVVSRADLEPPDVTETLRRIRADAAIVSISGRTERGLGAWLAAQPAKPSAPLVIDYDRYAAAEASLGWFDGRARIRAESPFSTAALLTDLVGELRAQPIAHLKIAVLEPGRGAVALVRRDGAPVLDLDGMARQTTEMRILVNARISLSPGELEPVLRRAVARASHGATVTWEDVACFEPGRPTPVHRYAYRCGSGDDASCCAAFYDRPEVRYLLGDSLHPGGTTLTCALAEHLGLKEGARLLDVACGGGASLRAIAVRWPVVGVGLDVVEPPKVGDAPRSGIVDAGDVAAPSDGRIRIVRGDAHRIPFEAASFDALLCECAVSTFADPRGAMAEMKRVLATGGKIAVSDMIVEGHIPELLRPYAHTGACLAGARTERGWRELFEDAGFSIARFTEETPRLLEMIASIKRKLVGAALAKASGVLPEGIDIDVTRGRDLLREAERTVKTGAVRYGAWILTR